MHARKLLREFDNIVGGQYNSVSICGNSRRIISFTVVSKLIGILKKKVLVHTISLGFSRLRFKTDFSSTPRS